MSQQFGEVFDGPSGNDGMGLAAQETTSVSTQQRWWWEGDEEDTSVEVAVASKLAWGNGDATEAKRHMRERQKAITGHHELPWATFLALNGIGPSGDRYEHLRDCMSFFV